MSVHKTTTGTPRPAELQKRGRDTRYRHSFDKVKNDLGKAKESGNIDRIELRRGKAPGYGESAPDMPQGNIEKYERYARYGLKPPSRETIDRINKEFDKLTRLTGREHPHIGGGTESDNGEEAGASIVISESGEAVISEGGEAAETAEAIENDEAEKAPDDTDDTTESESVGRAVAVNAGKRARMIAAASDQSEVQTVLQLLQQDLAECQEGLDNGWCDESEVAKVEALIEMANQRMSEVAGNDESEEAGGVDAFMLASLY